MNKTISYIRDGCQRTEITPIFPNCRTKIFAIFPRMFIICCSISKQVCIYTTISLGTPDCVLWNPNNLYGQTDCQTAGKNTTSASGNQKTDVTTFNKQQWTAEKGWSYDIQVLDILTRRLRKVNNMWTAEKLQLYM